MRDLFSGLIQKLKFLGRHFFHPVMACKSYLFGTEAHTSFWNSPQSLSPRDVLGYMWPYAAMELWAVALRVRSWIDLYRMATQLARNQHSIGP